MLKTIVCILRMQKL